MSQFMTQMLFTSCCQQYLSYFSNNLLIKSRLSQNSKDEGNDRESVQSNTIPDPGNHMGK